ncbi:motility associated factor glycosyltransferase family protein [Pseudomaricurvus alkylphenolicus]|uniref:motility associated factor glycosyltransferase family protein n=1 Tax=Pseudomaricurvus alkylphenolicus TaxID=1306991 RepID=UPI00142193BA|nr:6-hydroxymethylpterin diphosphokinase MptE-like protein [Pseudomaricurvus alkylphenolicus]NIB43229.1 motility associated factor glycosyltransferase family protein [Pseudomaricurvus alkylphenolicus]
MTDINELLRQAEMKHRQLQMEVQFQKNMELLKLVAPALHERFLDYTPEELRLSYDSNNEVNLVNFQLNNKPVYPKNPVEFCSEQVDRYLAKPFAPIVQLQKTEDTEKRFFQIELVNQVLDKYDRSINNPTVNCDAPIGLMLITGCGLGYHIESLTLNLNIQNLCIYDPHPDSFYASMHIINWEPIIRSYIDKGGTIKFYIGMSKEAALLDMRSLGDKLGLFNMSLTYVYRHFKSKDEAAFVERYLKEYHLNLTGIGFLEDEQISVAHSANNLNLGIPIFQRSEQKFDLPPAVIVGNGPSLDNLIDTLKDIQDQVIIFSCGSATPTLYRAGLKPDVHIEMERTSPTADWLKEGTSDEFLRDITLIALNTVSPNTFELFDRKAIFNKPNDLGADIINAELGCQLPPLGFCNPTVTNSGLSAAIYLGFMEIYLFGVDLGMINEDEHHSKNSLYYEMKESTQDIVGQRYKENTYQRKGNFRDKIITNTDFDTSRSNMEAIIGFVKKGRDIKIYNLNDGAFIEGATPLHLVDFNPSQKERAKSEYLDELLSASFLSYEAKHLDADAIRSKYLQEFYPLRPNLQLTAGLDNPVDILQDLNRVFANIKAIEQSSATSAMLIRGSVNSFFTAFTRACLFESNKDECRQKYEFCRQVFERFVTQAYELVDNRLLENDKTGVIWDY